MYNSILYDSFLYITKQLYKTDYFDSFVVYNINCKLENAILNVKLRKLVRDINTDFIPTFFYIGTSIDNSFLEQLHIGLDMTTLLAIVYGRHFSCYTISKTFRCHFLTRTEPSTDVCQSTYLINMLTIFVSGNLLYNSNALFAGDISASFNNILSDTYAHLYDIHNKKAHFLYLLGSDYYSYKLLKTSTTFIVYQGHHADYGSRSAALVFPTVTHFECRSTHLSNSGMRRFLNPVMRSYLLSTKLNPLTDIVLLTSLNYHMYFYINKYIYRTSIDLMVQMYYFNSVYVLKNILFKINSTYLKFYKKSNFSIELASTSLYKARFSIEDCLFIHIVRNFYNIDVFTRASVNVLNYLKVI